MPSKPKHICNHPGCNTLCNTTYCDAHAKQRNIRDNRSSYHYLYNTNKWIKLRQQILIDNPLCILCKIEHKWVLATVVDHITPHKGNESLFYDVNNLQALCKICHDKKTAEEDGGFGNKIKSKIK